MRNLKSIKTVNESRCFDFVVPRHEDYCFANIFGTIKQLFNIVNEKGLPKDVLGDERKPTNKVIFFLVDAFGFEFYERIRESSEFFRDVEEFGVVSKLTAQFPAATTSEITTALSNEKVYEHGIYEWFYYEPVIDNNITAFLFKEKFSDISENLKVKGINPEEFLPTKSFFKELRDNNIKSIAYQHKFINDSIYSKYMFRYAYLKDYDTYNNLLNNLILDVKKDKSKEYYYVYISDIDSIGHMYGANSPEFKDALMDFVKFIDDFYKGINNIEGIDIVVSADHGQLSVDPEEIIYLNKEVLDIDSYLKRNKNGDIYSPCGYVRDLFLHVKEEKLDSLKSILEDKLLGKAKVYKIEDLISLNIFGGNSERFKARVGNLVVIPINKNIIWLYDSFNQKGVHGGLSKEEMHIPFLYYKTK